MDGNEWAPCSHSIDPTRSDDLMVTAHLNPLTDQLAPIIGTTGLSMIHGYYLAGIAGSLRPAITATISAIGRRQSG